ncbi:alpha/beta hydrolase [Oscillatoria sp. FACHB-1406]|uniref:alpha/beta hydrolase n=1 Tax=Oscillatoria sp. FACHB-1406 TaxID=2692846 RepID=UPI001689414A|nr:alpha/beta hydrolase [Oscillatoria sp. FACHB-1406]MBD2577425.1 alpha/beta hydrolase [Oscillatoria sp. FACHB-1406]
MALESISLAPKSGKSATHLFVALHGWGANSRDLASLAPFLNLPDMEMIFPEAPFSHPQIAGGRAWYALERSGYAGLDESRQLLTNWLLSLETTTGIPLARTILAGFSQGGAMTLDVGLQLPLAGLCCLSGYLHSAPQPGKQPPPVLSLHGRQDYVVPISLAREAKQKLEAAGVTVEYSEFDMGHEISPEALAVLREFLERY